MPIIPNCLSIPIVENQHYWSRNFSLRFFQIKFYLCHIVNILKIIITMRKRFFVNLSVITYVIFFISCSGSRLDVDVSDIDVELKVKRLDKALFDKPTGDVVEQLPDIMTEYGDFFDIYASVLNLGSTGSSTFSYEMETYLSNPQTLEIKKIWKEKFDDITPYINGLTEGFRHFKYYYPDTELPEIYTCVVAFNYSAFTTENALGIGLDMFFGSDNEIYQKLAGRPPYLNLLSDPKRIKIAGLEAWTRKMFEFNDSIDNVLSNAIYEGKVLYFLNAMFPDTPDHLIIGYTEEQINWCELSEKDMWDYLVDKKLFFSTKKLDIKKLTGPGSFTHFFSHNSPGGAGKWMGWQIVRSYVENNNIGLQQLMRENNYHKIFNRAKYKPN